MSDHIVRAIVQDAGLRAIAVSTTATSREAVERHRCAPTSGILLSEALTAGLLLARLHKTPRRINLQIECDGPVRGLVVDADADGRVRGFVRDPSVDFPSAEGPRTEPAFGTKGMVNVLREMKEGEWYRGLVELPARSVARGVEAYLATSEQVESVMDLAVRLGPDGVPEAAAGILFQRLPDGNRAALELMRTRLLEGYLRDALAEAGDAPAAGVLLDGILGGAEGKGGANLQIFDRAEVGFRCGCSLERVEAALTTLGPDELESMIEEEGGASVTCDFCGERYTLGREDLERLRGLSATG